MRRTLPVVLLCFLADGSAPAGRRVITEALQGLPLAFEPNVGQTAPQVDFVARTRGGSVFLTADGPTLAFPARARAVRLRLAGSSAATGRGEKALPGTVSLFLGSDRKAWRTGVPTYGQVLYPDVYPGIDVAWYGTHRDLEYDLLLHPGADDAAVALAFDGADALRVDAAGDLHVGVAGDELLQLRPRVFQGGKEIDGRYVLTGERTVRIALGPHDRSEPLRVDPILTWSTFIGGQNDDYATAVAVDATGAAWVTGFTLSTFPTTPGVLQQSEPGGRDAFVAKLTPTFSAFAFSTYLGGSGDDDGLALALDGSGNAYVAGSTTSADFPVTTGALKGGIDAFVARLNGTGSVLGYATYLGGTGDDIARGIAVDPAGSVYVVGDTASTDFPVTAGVVQAAPGGGNDAFVAKLSNAAAITWATYLGGSAAESATGVALDAASSPYVVGATSSPNFPTTAGAFQTTHGGAQASAFVAKLAPDGASLVYGTYLGASGEVLGQGIALDPAGDAYVAGSTTATDFPVSPGAPQLKNGGGTDAFIAALDASGSALLWSTYLGGNGEDAARAIAVDATGRAYASGVTGSTDFPTTTGSFHPLKKGGNDAFVVEVTDAGTALGYATYFGGSRDEVVNGLALDASGEVFIAGSTTSQDMTTTLGVVQNFSPAGTSAFVAALNPAGNVVTESTYLSGANADFAFGLAVDGAGNTYVSGQADALSFPTTAGVIQTANAGGHDAVIFKLNPSGSSFVWSAYLGGSSEDAAQGLAVDATGAAYVVGFTQSADFPITAGALQATNKGAPSFTNVFVSKLNPTASMLDYSTFLGGTRGDYGEAVAVDGAGDAWITGYTTSLDMVTDDFPVTVGAQQTSYGGGIYDAIFAGVSPTGSTLLYSTYLGGSKDDLAWSIALDPSGGAYLAGYTASLDFPTTKGSFQTTSDGGYEAFAVKYLDGGLAYSTYLGGSLDDYAYAVAVDGLGRAVVSGETDSLNYPITPGAFQPDSGGGLDIFLTRLNAAGSGLDYSTYLGGSQDEVARGLCVDDAGDVFVVGDSLSPDYPVTADAFQPALSGGYDAVISELSADGRALLTSTYLGGSSNEFGRAVVLDPNGAAHVTGHTTSPDFPTTPGVVQATFAGGVSTPFVASLSPSPPVDAGPGADAGADAGGHVDAGGPFAEDAGAADAGSPTPVPHGCGCGTEGVVPLALLAALALSGSASGRKRSPRRART